MYDNGESYEGEWNRGKRHGKGIYVYLNGEFGVEIFTDPHFLLFITYIE